MIVAAITSKEKMKLPTHIAIPEIEGLEKDSVWTEIADYVGTAKQ